MRNFVITGSLIGSLSFLALIMKGISQQISSQPLLANQPTASINLRRGLMWPIISLNLVFALAISLAALRAQRRGPFYCTSFQRACCYFTYHFLYVFSSCGFIALTFTGAHSVTDFSNTGSMDLEFWACNAKGAESGEVDELAAAQICTTESAARWLLLPVGIGCAIIAVLLEVDRRGEKALLRSWKVRARKECEMEEEEKAWSPTVKTEGEQLESGQGAAKTP
ncbi:hypothetical protein OQA88_9139 [Cercophora sp. LCS_1]